MGATPLPLYSKCGNINTLLGVLYILKQIIMCDVSFKAQNLYMRQADM